MRFAFDIHAQHLHLHDLARLHGFGRILDVPIRKLADVHQSILMHADIDERAELRHVGHHAFQHHPGCTSAISRTCS